MHRLLIVVLLVGCRGSDKTVITGDAAFRDATTTHTGSQASAAHPPSQQMEVSLTVVGTGTFPAVDPVCAADPVDVFVAFYPRIGSIDETGVYVTTLDESTITTPSGCPISDLAVTSVTAAVLRAELVTTIHNCETFCAASARADAEAACGADALTCRENTEPHAAAACDMACTLASRTIVAETPVDVGQLGHVDAGDLRDATFDDIEADLVFATLE